MKLREDGMDPQALRDRPVLDVAESYFRSVFFQLSDSRQTENGYPQPIPVSEILSYFEMFYVRGLSERDTLLRMIQTLDGVYIKKRSEQIAERQRKATQAKGAVAR